MGRYLELVEGSFTDEHYAKQDYSNYPYVAYSIVDKKVIYTIIPMGTMYTVYLVEQSDISGLTYNEVDLGLPSGLKWADRNVGSDSSEEYGCYFQWGDTTGYKFKGVRQLSAAELATLMQPIMFPDSSADDYVELTEDNIGDILVEQGIEGTDLTTIGSGFVKNKLFNWSNYFDTTDGGLTFTKYETNKKTVLDLEDDAAYIYMGSDWRMPTYDEFTELINNTTPTFIDLDGNEFSKSDAQSGAIAQYNLKGIKLTGTNGNSIFIPAAGYCFDTALIYVSGYGYLWSSSLSTSDSRGLNVNYNGGLSTDYSYRYYGFSVRGVK